jgi:MoaA/NifB/PqqE/SkfB family radical SAM enzyme
MSSNKNEKNYGFQEGLTSEFPSQLIIDITEICNLECVHCPHVEFKKSSHFASRFLEPELNTKMINEVRDFGSEYCKYIRYTSNGEPLIHPKGYSMIKEAVDNSGTFVCLTTNGTIMKEKKTRQLLDSGIHMIDISIDAYHAKTYSDIRVGGDLEVTRSNVLRLMEWASKDNYDTKIVVSFVEQPNNTEEVELFRKYWEEQGASFVVIRRMHSAAGAVDSIAEAMHNKINNDERYPCIYPWERLVLDPKGLLAFCPADWSYSSPAGDIRTETIREVWKGEFMNNLREAHLSNNYSCHGFCGQCPDWSSTRWPHDKGSRRYANMIDDIKEDTIIDKSEEV